MKHWKKQGKRGLSLFLSMVMCLSMVNLTAFATENGLTAGIVADGAFEAENGKLGAYNENASKTVTAGDKIEITKDAKAIRCEDGNQFEVTLTVVTKDQEITQVKSPDAAVSLVIDVSGSMETCATCGKAGEWYGWQYNYSHKMTCEHFNYWDNAVKADQTRLAAAKASARDFLDSLKEHTPQNSDGTYPARYVSVVAFSDGASRKCEWKDIVTTEGYDAVLKAINGLTANGGTRPDRGLDQATTLMQNSAVNTVDKGNKFTVLLTDGQPDGDWPTKTLCNMARTSATTLKENSNAIYSVFYGDASKTCYDTVTIEAFLRSFSNSVYSAGTAGQLNTAFENISQTITLLTKAWEVYDPMGPGVKFEEVTSKQGTCVTAAKGGLTWDLKADVASVNGNTRTYTLKYLVTVDATGEDYDEEAVHALNDYTYLTYVIEGKDGGYTDADGNPVSGENPPTVGFNVPGVIVERPVRPWRIEYYQEDANGSVEYEGKKYTQVTGDTKTGKGKVQSRVSLSNIKIGDEVVVNGEDPDWETKYDNYTAVGVNQFITIQADSENVIRVYYNRKTTDATVNYHYELTIIDENGETTTAYVANGTPETGLFVGEEYSANAPETSTYGGYTYNFHHATPSGGKISKLDQDGGKNVIDVYYKATVDERAAASVVVDHVYTLHTYELEDGKYVAKDVVVEVPNVVSESGHRAGETYTASYYPTPDFSSYGYAGIVGRDNVKVLSSGPNVITLEFENWEDPRGEELSLTVNHHYTKSVTEIVDGNVVTTVEPDDEVGHTDTIKFYKGETVTVDKQREYNNDTYEIGGDSDTVVLPNPMNGAEYNLFYTLVEEPQKTTVTVEHIYQTVTHETVTTYEDVEKVIETETTDPETGETVKTTETVIEKVPTGTETVDHVVTDKTVMDDPVDVFVGQRYQATLKGENGYTYHSSTPTGYTIEACQEDGNNITIVYQKDDKADNRKEATIDVQHVYTTHVTAVIGGEVKNYETSFTVPGETYTGKAGDSYQAKTVPEYNGVAYTLVGSEPEAVVLHAGTNSTIVIKYERSDNQLGEQVGYTVNYEYYTRTMTVVDGVAVWGEPVKDETVPKEAVTGTGYAGQKVELETGAMSGYNAMEGNPSSIQFLKADGNEWTFKHVKDVPLDKVPVTVNHHVTIKTLTVDSESSATQDLMGRPEYKYAGESYEAKALDIGTLTLVNVNGSDVETQKVVTFDALSGTVVVDFYYEIVNDLRRPVDYSIQYYYYDVNYDGTETLTGEPPATTGSSFAGKSLATTPEEEDVKGYRLTEATFNEVDIMGQQSVTLVDGTNKIVYVYKRSVDTRDPVHATVFHEYYSSASATEPAYRDSVVTYDLRPGDSFTATEIFEKNGVTYQLAPNSDPLTITLDEDSQQNTITIRYVLAETTYKVVHTYYTNGSLTGSTDPVTVGGNVGDVVTADSVAKVLTYGGNSYSYTSSSGEFTLVQGENGTITLRYDRTTGGGGDNGGGNNNNNDDDDDDNGSGTPTPPVVDVPDEQPPLIEEPVIDIPDEQPPKEEAPEEEILEEEILEEEVPLSDVPQTGDNSKPVFWAVLGALSFLGIVLLGRKRKDEEA